MEPEWMDSPSADPDQLARSLEDLRQVSRWLGGRRTAVREMMALARRIDASPIRILDVGTGGADVPLALAQAARAAGMVIHITASDLHPDTLEYARRETDNEPWIVVEEADATALPFDDRRFHLAMCNTTLHHFSREAAVQVLREMNRVASSGVVVTDLERSAAAMMGVNLLAATLWRDHPITQHDGPASVRAAFTRAELETLGREAGLQRPVARRTPIFRLALTSRRS